MARDPKYDVLFEPIQIGPKTMKNRFYQIPHCNGFGSEKPLSQAYFRAMKAEGGYGACCTEYCSISPESDDTPPRLGAALGRRRHHATSRSCATCSTSTARSPASSCGTAGRTRRAWSRAACRAGRRRSRATSSTSRIRKEMDKDDIREVQQLYVDAAKRAREAGFDIVYVYGSHSYLPQQFLTPYYNKRTDEYGGSFENRARFWRETIEQVKEAVGDDYAIAVRMSTDMFMGEARHAARARLPAVRRARRRPGRRLGHQRLRHLGVGRGRDAVALLRVRAAMLPWQEAVKKVSKKPVARRRPLHEPGPDGRGDQRGHARHHRHLPARRSPIRSCRRRSRRAGSTTSASASAATSASRAGRSAARR